MYTQWYMKKIHIWNQKHPLWAFIQANFDPIQEIGPKVGGGHSFVGRQSFLRMVNLFYVPRFSDLE